MADGNDQTDERIRIASGFLMESPPGEVNDVFNDLRTLVDDDEKLGQGITDALRRYNIEQLVTVKLPGAQDSTIICEAAQVDEDCYVDPSAKKLFRFDHMRQEVSDVSEWTGTASEQTEGAASDETYRQALETAVGTYLDDHYPRGVSAVFAKHDVITITMVCNKYNPSNFWNGRWRSLWTLQRDTNTLKGTIRVDVHYYEDGNVQLASSKQIDTSVASTSSPDVVASQVIERIQQAENEFQSALNANYTQLSDKTFKSLRRTLPVTRKKLDWDKIANYKIGAELTSK